MTISAPSGLSHTLFIVPRGEGDGFRANVRGHILDLIDPSSYSLAPTADDLLVVSLAAAVAWSARSFLQARSLPDYVSVSAEQRTPRDPSSPWQISLIVTVSERVRKGAGALAAALEETLTARLASGPVIHLSFDDGDRSMNPRPTPTTQRRNSMRVVSAARVPCRRQRNRASVRIRNGDLEPSTAALPRNRDPFMCTLVYAHTRIAATATAIRADSVSVGVSTLRP
jgi:hypothetical protein